MTYRVTVQPSGHRFDCEPDESVLAAALRQGVTLAYGCRDGACGTCMGKVLAGEIRYPGELPPAISAQEAAHGLALFCQARPACDLEIEAKVVERGEPLAVRKLPVRVRRIERPADDVAIVYLELPAGERLQYKAGQWIEFVLKDGSRRGFSIANPPHRDELIELHVRHVPGGRFTDYVFSRLKEGALLRIEGPGGTFFLREDSDRPVLLMAGGTGFAPIKGIVEHAFHVGFGSPMHLFWGARSRKDLYLHEQVERWAREHPGFRYTPVLSEPRPGDAWQGKTGWVHERLLEAYPDLSGYAVYVAGPPPMITAAREAFLAHGLPEEEFHFDSFEYGADTLRSLAGREQAASD